MAQPIAQKTRVLEVLGLTPCFVAIVKTFKDGFMDIHISLLSDDGHKTLLTYYLNIVNSIVCVCCIIVFISFPISKSTCNLRI